MATYNGRNASVKKGTYTVAEFVSWSLKLGNDEIDTSAFGSTWKKTDVGQRGWSLSVEGHYDPSDTDGQKALETAWANGSLVNDVKLYVDNTSYWVPDVTTDASAGGRVTDYECSMENKGVGKMSMTLSGSGPITFV